MQSCRNDVVYMMYMHECMNAQFFVTSETDKTGRVRWEVDRHRSTNTRQSSLGDNNIRA